MPASMWKRSVRAKKSAKKSRAQAEQTQKDQVAEDAMVLYLLDKYTCKVPEQVAFHTPFSSELFFYDLFL